MSKTILFVSGPFDGLVIDAERVESIPHSQADKEYKILWLYRVEHGTWWEYGYVLRGNVATYSQANNRPHVLAHPDPTGYVKSFTFHTTPPVFSPSREEHPAALVEALLLDPRTFRLNDGTP